MRQLSYSALALFSRCSYRFYAERVVGMRPRTLRGDASANGGLAATEIGDAVHTLLERLDLSDPCVPAELEQAVRASYPQASAEEIERVGRLVEAYCSSELAARIASLPGAAAEQGFAFEHDGVLFHGRLDVVHRATGRALVVDYKTNVLEDVPPEEVVEREYRLQRLVYAIACLRGGADSVEVVHQFLERADAIVSTTYERHDLAALEAELSEAVGHIQAGDFRPTPGELVCPDCPVLGVVCAGPALRVHGATEPAAVVAG
jgi:hypothetical protein